MPSNLQCKGASKSHYQQSFTHAFTDTALWQNITSY